VTQQNNTTNAHGASSNGNGNEADPWQGHGDDSPQPAVAHPSTAPGTARDSGAGAASDNKQAGGGNANGGTAARTTPPQVASPADKPNVGGHDNADSHGAAPAPAAKPQPTPTPPTSRRGSDGSDNGARPTPVPGRNASDQHGSGSGDNGHPGD